MNRHGRKVACLVAMVSLRAVLLVGVVSLPTLLAAEQRVTPKVYGIGVQPCAEWVAKPGAAVSGIAKLEASAKEMAVIAWLTGYVTGAAAVLADRGMTLKDTSGRDILVWVTEYCTSHKGATVEEAAAALVKELAGPAIP